LEEKPTHEKGLQEYLHIIRKRIWLLLLIFVVTVTVVAIASYNATPIYSAIALLRIEKSTPSIVSIEDVYQADVGPDEYYETQYKLIRSRRVCSEVFNRLGLGESERYENSRDKVGAFSSDVIVEPIPDTYLVNVSYESPVPELAAKIANAVVDEYVSYVKREKKVISEEAESKITERIPELGRKLRESEDTLRLFEEENSALSFQKRREIIYTTLASLNRRVTEVKQELAKAEARHASVSAAESAEEILSLPDVVNNSAIQAYGREKLTLDARKAELVQTYKPDSSPVKAIDNKIDVVEKKIMDEASRIVQSVRMAMEEKKSEEQKLEALLEEHRELAKSFDKNVSRYDALKADVEQNRGLYQEFMQRRKELESSSQMDLGMVQIVDRAEVPRTPVRPRKMLNMLLAVVLSLLGSVGLALFLEYMDDSIKNHEDIEKYVGLPLLGVVPAMKVDGTTLQEKDKLAHLKPRSAISEAFRNVRTGLLYSAPNQESRAYVVTSAGPQEGKTTASTNLAIVLANAGKKVLLVDSDLRKPRINKTFSIDGGKGLTNYLVGQDSAEDCIAETEIENLSVMPSGPIPPNPAELLGSPKMKELIAELKKTYDTVIFDSPPVVVVTDAAVLAAQCDGAIQVIWAGHTSRKLIGLGREKIEAIGARIIGVVLNNVRSGQGGYYHYYPRYYKYYSSQDSTPSKT
jgi:capsular exopolysaccharide synthesis family protein